MRPKFHWYYIILAIPLYLLALLPMRLIYIVSDVLRFVVYYIFGYRKKVVFENLRKSFPEKGEKWIEKTAWDFYRNLFDVTLETLCMATLSKSYYSKHIKFHNLHLVQTLNARNQPFILVCGHMANWEWAGQSLHLVSAQVDVLYHPLSNSWFEWYVNFMRTRFGVYTITMQSTLREMLKRKTIPTAVSFVADQTPGPEGCHWMTFLNQDTPVFVGVEKLAKKFNYPVLYGEMVRVKRGYYEIDFIPITNEPKLMGENEITETHMHLLEKVILRNPESWLWSHRRWKHKRRYTNEN
jgi:Kdo2-lipid IVA lauroyltransferase/acyltransferase